eukprot:CAMPEP_0185901514 /NCGR_PEP_ID=MMETSP0196C-20130402/877_1 /TAXON_ID=2932 /ORGANISM="Alexandrium fundyense, Strain CCMP1719" /LENGTH=197 /DNA_ID=CAMNT_0028620177 /DNA_START=156 /DNA_END=746 /DNA_ORIENTATION=-
MAEKAEADKKEAEKAAAEAKKKVEEKKKEEEEALKAAGKFATHLRAKVLLSASEKNALDDMKLGDLTRTVIEMGFSMDFVYDALNTDFPHDTLVDIIMKSKMDAELDPTQEHSKKCHSPMDINSVVELAAQDSDPNSATYFFLHKSVLLSLPEGPMPVFQDLAQEGLLRAFRINAKLVMEGKRLRNTNGVGELHKST